ncbi:MAG: PD-(D/E)XK nuclease family protein [Chloroflexi bacterium]|nr:PD-(D/E)XK nuclease family protein [Chloroflexota bacterium]
MNFRQTLTEIQTILDTVDHDSDLFVEALQKQAVQHLSFSQISTVEFCQQRYYLQYILNQEPDPLPDYFTKGKLLHRLIAHGYQAQMAGNIPSLADLEEDLATANLPCDHAHLTNALQVYHRHRWQTEQVLAVEHPFVLSIDENLPPLVGVIDLVLQEGNTIILVDHKTGRNFYPYDELQVAIYASYIQAQYPGYECHLYYDHYRWVNNLDRIRKPAFQRTRVEVQLDHQYLYRQRILTAASLIHRLRSSSTPSHSGKCYRCPYRYNCPYSYRENTSD